MPSKPLKLSQTQKAPQRSSVRPGKLKTVKLGSVTPNPSQTSKPLTAFAKPPVFDIGSQRNTSKDAKGKRKADGLNESKDDRLWVDMYEPTTEAELAVHKKKVEDVRRWFVEAFDGGPSGKLKKYRRILALTGPAGTAKTATVRVLARELGFEILEWRNSMSEKFSRDESSDDDDFRRPSDQEALFTKFQAFLTRASSCQSIFAAGPSTSMAASSQPSQHSTQLSSSSKSTLPRRQIILLEDLPNIIHAKTQEKFHAALQALVESSVPGVAPVVIIVSDAGTRGEATDERIASGGGSGGAWGKDVVDIRSVLSGELLHSAYVTQISFNPIAPTLMRKALQALLSLHFSSSSRTAQQPSKEILDVIVESSNGDIRSAIMALQFACIVELPSNKKGKKAGTGGDARVILEAVTRREQSLALFHLIGKVLYNKRKGDPPNPSGTAKDIQREKDLDAALKDSLPLPSYMAEHARRTSRVDVDAIYADSPIDSSLFSLYIQQNYSQFCSEMEECDGVAEWLSYVDSSGGEAWHQANPHRFHLLTLGTLHSLPSPVPRRSQKFFKPDFFDMLKRERDAADGVSDVRRWLTDMGLGTAMGSSGGDASPNWRVGGWSRAEIAIELGGVLKAMDRQHQNSSQGVSNLSMPPSTHRLFSSLLFRKNDSEGSLLREGDDGGIIDVNDEASYGTSNGAPTSAGVKGGWLENDDIEDF